MKKNEKGFSAVEILIVVVIVGLIGGVGLYVLSSQKKTNNALDNSTTQNVTQSSYEKEGIVETKDESAGWLIYKSPKNDFEIRLADGWGLTHISDGRLYTEDMTKLVLKPGTKATITENDANSPSTGFVMDYVDEGHYTPAGEKQASFKTSQGLTVDKYIYTQTVSVPGSGLLKDGKSFEYYVTKNGKTFWVIARFQPGDPDTHETIEKVIKTLIIN